MEQAIDLTAPNRLQAAPPALVSAAAPPPPQAPAAATAARAAGGTQSDARSALPQAAMILPAASPTNATGNIAFRAHLAEKDAGGQSSATSDSSSNPSPNAAQAAAVTREPSPFGSGGGNADGQNASSGNSGTPDRGPEEATADVMPAGAPVHATLSDAVVAPVANHAASPAPERDSGTAAAPMPSSTRLEEAAGASPALSTTQTVPREISIRVARPDAQPVDVQIRQRAGEIQVAVRTPDEPLQRSLRSELPDLVGSLDRAGYRTEVFAGASSPSGGSPMDAHGDSSNQRGSQSHTGSGQDAGRNPGSAQQQSAQQQSAQQQNARDRLAQNWLDQMEE